MNSNIGHPVGKNASKPRHASRLRLPTDELSWGCESQGVWCDSLIQFKDLGVYRRGNETLDPGMDKQHTKYL